MSNGRSNGTYLYMYIDEELKVSHWSLLATLTSIRSSIWNAIYVLSDLLFAVVSHWFVCNFRKYAKIRFSENEWLQCVVCVHLSHFINVLQCVECIADVSAFAFALAFAPQPYWQKPHEKWKDRKKERKRQQVTH